ncbi:hypothetical protein MPTA5024_23355 [Microbispora sp. ATCC PTA-5024]|nr:hypothetical protein MPTA5024_23355 [Microbispora sp. ATCC PTA-5024]
MLRDGRADAALLHHPREDLTGLDVEELRVEKEQVAVLPRGHRLAGRTSLTMADLAGEAMPRWPHMDSGDGPLVTEVGQLQELIALGRAVVVSPESVRGHLRRDLVSVPVVDAPPTALVLAWAEARRSRALAAFVRVASAVAAGHHTDADGHRSVPGGHPTVTGRP